MLYNVYEKIPEKNSAIFEILQIPEKYGLTQRVEGNVAT